MEFELRKTTEGELRGTTDGGTRITTDEIIIVVEEVARHQPGMSGINQPHMTQAPPIHPGELEFFRVKVYARGVDGMIPPPVVANSNLTTRHFPNSRPVVDRTPRRK